MEAVLGPSTGSRVRDFLRARCGPGAAAAAGVVAFALAVGLREINDPDYWTHLAFGRAFAAARSAAVPEPFLAGPDVSTVPVTSTEWPFQVALYLWREAAGDAGVSVAFALVLAGTALALSAPIRRMAAGPRLAAAAVFLAAALALARFRFVPRPEAVAYVLLAAVLSLARGWTRSPGWAALLGTAALLAVWRELHVSWTLGAALAGLVVASRPRLDFWRRQPRVALVAAAAGAAWAVVEALRFAGYVIGALRGGGALAQVTEMQPTWEFPTLAVPFVALAACGVALAWGAREGRIGRLALAAAAVVAGGVVVRNVALGALVLAFAAIDGLASLPPAAERRRRNTLAGGLAAVVLAALAAVSFRDRDPAAGLGVDWRWFPRDAAEFVRARRLPGPVFNSWELGGFLDWAWAGDPPTFLDGRIHGGRLELHDAVVVARTAEAALARGGFATVVLSPVYGNDGALVDSVPWFLGHPGWRLVRASDALVFARAPLPAGVDALDPREGWQAVLRRAEVIAGQTHLDPAHVHYTRAAAFFRLGELSRAREELEKGRRRHPEAARFYGGLARALGMGGPA